MKFHIETWGCQMNVMDSHFFEGAFVEAGLSAAVGAQDADLIILNTCSVREHAENKVLSRLGVLTRLKEVNTSLKIVVAGCMAQRMGGEITRKFPAVDLVLGTGRIADIVALTTAKGGAGCMVCTDGMGDAGPERYPYARAGAAHAYVCAMRGCDNFCAYCIVPKVRGRQVSRPAAKIIAEIEALCADGVKVVTLLGQNISAWGRDLGEGRGLAFLLEAVHEVAGLEWIKFLTCHPRDTDTAVFEAMRDLPKVASGIHLPAQAGSDFVLRAMKRGYTRREYLSKVAQLRDFVPQASIVGDFIVGFPGEREADFNDTLSLLEETGFRGSFVFKYSPRPGTAAAHLADDVPMDVKARRNNDLLALQRDVSLAQNRSFIGRRVRVFVEGPSRKNPDELTGRTLGDEVVIFAGSRREAGSFAQVDIFDASAAVLFGREVP